MGLCCALQGTPEDDMRRLGGEDVDFSSSESSSSSVSESQDDGEAYPTVSRRPTEAASYASGNSPQPVGPRRTGRSSASSAPSNSIGTMITMSFSMQPAGDMRAVSARALLANFGHIWSESKAIGSTGGRQMWSRTEEYDIFVSHSWSAGRFEKYLALLLIFNGRAALAVGALCGPLMGMLEVYFDFPEITDWEDQMQIEERTYVTRFRWWAEIVGFLATAFTTLCWQLNEGCLTRRKDVFLDRVSIVQDDVEKKKMGIRCLPGYLNRSNSLLVLWSKEYLSRLWCVLELATWVNLNKPAVSFVPVMSAQTIFGYFIFVQLMCFSKSIYQSFDMSDRWKLVFIYIPVFGACFVSQAALLKLTRSRQELDRQLKEFDCTKAKCREEEDREMILDQIKVWFGSKAMRAATSTSNLSEADAAYSFFNKVVRKKVFRRLRNTEDFTASTLPYEWVLLACLPVWWRWSDITASAIEGGLPVKNVVNLGIHGFFRASCYSPLLLQFFLWCNGWLAATKVSVLVNVLRLLGVCLFVSVLDFAGELMANFVLQSNSYWFMAVVDSSLALITGIVFSSRVRSTICWCSCVSADLTEED